MSRTPDLPAPVGRFLRRSLPAERRIVEVELAQEGRLRTDPGSARWLSFTATHRAFPEEVRFAWDARVRLAPLLSLSVLDSFREGHGAGTVRLGPFALGRSAGSPEIDAGSLHRFLAEAAWYPSFLVPSTRLAWAPLDAARAVATLTDHGTTVALEVRFTSEDDLVGVFTPERWGRFEGGFRQAPWEGRFADWAERDGIRFPTTGEAGWHVDGRYVPVWQGRVKNARFRCEDLGNRRPSG